MSRQLSSCQLDTKYGSEIVSYAAVPACFVKNAGVVKRSAEAPLETYSAPPPTEEVSERQPLTAAPRITTWVPCPEARTPPPEPTAVFSSSSVPLSNAAEAPPLTYSAPPPRLEISARQPLTVAPRITTFVP